MKNLIPFIFLLLVTRLTAQEIKSLRGTVHDDADSPVGLANITVIKLPDNTIATGTVADADGRFTVKSPTAGRYLLRISATGYAILETDAFDVTENMSKDFGTVMMKRDINELNEVIVESLRPQITQDADKMVVRVEGTAMASGNTAFTVLSRMPGVFVDPEGNIRLNGKSGVTVMIDGKLTYLSAADLRNMLEGMAAENIKNIEIINNPSAKFDAEGTSGILNINLKKNTRLGMSGSIHAGYTYNFLQHGYTYGGNINYKSGKWNSFFNADASRRVGGREATFTRIFYAPETTTYFDQYATGNWNAEGPPSVRMGTDYSITDKHTVGATVSYNTNTLHQDFITDTQIGSTNNTFTYIDADNFSKNTFTNYKANLHYIAKLDTIGTVFSTDLDYVKIVNRGHGNFYNYFVDLTDYSRTQDFLYTETPNGYDIWSGKIDFVRPFGKGQKIETGLKASHVLSDNDSQFYFNNNGLVPDLSRSNYFIYEEHIYAAYISWDVPLGNTWNLKTGLRAEETVSDGKSVTTGERTKRDYLNLFPSLFLQQKVTDNYDINYSYSRRITRPNYGNLNPFRAYRDPYTWWEGNPYLRPQYTHSFSLAQIYKKTYHLTLSYDIEKDVMSEIPILDVDSATTVYTTGNVSNGHTADLTALIPVQLAKWWETQNTAALFYNRFSTETGYGETTNEQLSFTLQSNHTIKLPAELRLELNMMYQGAQAAGLYLLAPMHRVDIALKKSFLDKKLDVVLRANDLFKGFRYKFITDINGNVNEFDQYFRFNNIGISLRYNFSKGQKVESARTNTVEELNRT